MPKGGIKLRFAISMLVMITVFCTVLISWYSSSKALRGSITKNYLDSNEKYAAKLSMVVNSQLHELQGNINAMEKIASSHQVTQEGLDEWRLINHNQFNSLFITDPKGVIQVISPAVVQFNKEVKAGTRLQTDTMKKALSIKKPFISKTYRATSGQLIILISAPIFDEKGKYKGLIGGTIYLESDNVIKHILDNNKMENGSYVYVVDEAGRIVYHPDLPQNNEDLAKNLVVRKVIRGNSGSTQITDHEGKQFLAGYAYEKNTGWGIVSQTPSNVMEAPLHDLLKKVIVQALPFLLFILIVAGILAQNLSKPLSTLAKYSEDVILHKKVSVPFDRIKISSQIYEVRQLYRQFSKHINLLNNQLQVDGLTGLANRRSFDWKIKEWIENNIPFSLIMIDVDHFKVINDTFGHLAGDDVLKQLSSIIYDFSNESTLCFRYGGEEFGVMIREKSIEDVFQLAEKLREKVAKATFPIGKPITISLGISTFQDYDQPEAIINRADLALYQSKSGGRNRTTIFGEKQNIAQ